MSPPFLPLYVADYLSATTHLNAAESGAYLHLLMHYWQKGSLPQEDKFLARIAKVRLCEWKRIADTITELFRKDAQSLSSADRALGVGRVRENIPASVRNEIFERDAGACVYCGVSSVALHLDHIMPFSRGGSSRPENLVLACVPCNLSKGAKTPGEWLS